MGAELGSVLAVLAEMGSLQPGEVSTDLAARLRNLLDTVANKVQDALASLTEEENQSIAEYNDRKERLTKLIGMIEELLEHLAEYIHEMEKCVKTEEDIINAATAKRVRNQHMLDYALDMCRAFAENYREATKARATEIDTLQKLRKFILSKADQFGAFEGGEIEAVFSGKKEGAAPAEASFV
jgi:DNA repair exonuclease SbcCD ATPase subunit